MSRRNTNVGLILLFALAVHITPAVAQPPVDAIHSGAAPAMPQNDWDKPFDPGDSGGHERVAAAADAVKLTAFETPPVAADGGELELTPPDQMFDLPPEGMNYSRGSRERIIDRVVDPTAWLMNFRFRESWNSPAGNSSGDSEEFEFRPTIPFRAWDHVNIFRVTIPYRVSGPGGAGLEDVTILDLVVNDAEWGRWGVGPVVRMTPGGTGSFQLGPAVGAVTKDEHWTVGFLMQNFFADDVAETRFQPILVYKLDDRWAVGAGEFEFRYNWERTDWTQVPLGVQVDYIAEIGGQKTHFFVNPQYNFESDASNSGWTLFLGMSLLVPGA